MSRYRAHRWAAAFGVLSAIAIVVAAPTVASADEQVVSAGRPQGQVAIGDVSVGAGGRLALTVTDTRADDPGWTVSVTVSSAPQLGWKPYVVLETAPFASSDGTVYAQEVTAGPPVLRGGSASSAISNAILGSAERGHGLGVAVLGAKLTAVGHPANNGASVATVTVTVV